MTPSPTPSNPTPVIDESPPGSAASAGLCSREEDYKPPYMCWFEGDFWADRDVIKMTWLQRHFYRALLLAAFQCDTRPYLPDDDGRLWRLADARNAQAWKDNREAVLSKFTRLTDGRGRNVLANKRVLEEWRRAITQHAIAVEKGISGRKKQLFGVSDKACVSNTALGRSPGTAQESAGTAQHIYNHSTQPQLQLQPQGVFSLGKKEPKKAFVLPEWVPKEAWDAYLEMRRRARKAATPTAIRLAIKKLGELRELGDDPKDVLEQSVLNSWQGIFPLQNPRRKGIAGYGHIKGDPNVNRAAAAEALRRIEARENGNSQASDRTSYSGGREPDPGAA